MKQKIGGRRNEDKQEGEKSDAVYVWVDMNKGCFQKQF